MHAVGPGAVVWAGEEKRRDSSEGLGMVIYISLAVALIGALVYALAVNPKLAELGRLAFGCGLLAFLLEVGRVLVGRT